MSGGEIYVSFGGDTAALEASLASAKASVNAFARELAALSREQHATGVGADSEIGQRMLALAAQLAQAKGAVSGLKGELGELGKGAGPGVGEATLSIGVLGDSLKHMAELAGIAFSVEAIKDWISSTTEAAEKIQQIGAKLGATPEQVQALGAEAKLAGGDFEEMQTQMERLQLSLAKTGEKASPAAAALHALGIGVQEFRGATMTGQLEMLAGALSRYADGANKTAAMQALLGRSGTDMIPFLDRGKQGIEELNAVIERTGVVMSGETVAAFAKTREDINEMSTAWQALSQRIYGVVNPAVDAAIVEITKLLELLNADTVRAGLTALSDDAIDLSSTVIEYALRAGQAIDDLLAKFGGLQSAMQSLDTFAAAMSGDHAALGQVFKGLADAVGGPEGGDEMSSANADAFGGLNSGAERLEFNLQAVRDQATAAKDAMHAFLAASDTLHDRPPVTSNAAKPQPGAMNLGGNAGADEAAKAAEAEANLEVDAYKRAATAKAQILDEGLKTHQLTMSQWLAQTVDALNDEAQDVSATYDAELQIAGLTSAKKLEIAKQEADALAEIQHQIVAAQAKAAEQAAQQWQSVMQTINSAFDSQIAGLLGGTENWHRAFLNVLKDLTEKLVEFGINKALTFGENAVGGALGIPGAGGAAGGAVTTANTSAVSLLTASINALNVAMGGVVPAATAQTVATTANTTATGASDAVSAAGTTATLGNTVATISNTIATDAAAIAHFFGFATGTPYVKNTGLALIHQGEAILPADSNPFAGKTLSLPNMRMPGLPDDAFHPGGGSPGGAHGGAPDVHSHVHMNVSAVDGQSVSRMLHENSDAVLKALAKQAGRGGRSALRQLGYRG